MFRIVLIGFVVSILVTEGKIVPNNSNDSAILSTTTENLDPIILGQTISLEHKKRWALDSAKFHECGLCGEEAQAYPGD
jgi:hypothetical protein